MPSPHARLNPYGQFNLWHNPFGPLTPDTAAAVAVPAPGVDLAALARHLQRPGAAVEILGRRGRGKTTHVHALRRRIGPQRSGRSLLATVPYVYVPAHAPVPAVPAAPVIALDETQRIPARQRRHLFERQRAVPGGALLIGTHRSHAPELRRLGFEVTTIRLGGLDAGRLAEIVRRRMEAARRGPGPLPTLAGDACRRLCARFGDDLRAIEGALYEAVERRLSPTLSPYADRPLLVIPDRSPRPNHVHS